MIAKCLIDTNILLYSLDRRDLNKQTKAIEVLNQLALSGTGVISTQILGEFFTVVTSSRKFPEPLSVTEAYEYIEDFLLTWEVMTISPMIVLEAIRGVKDYQFSFWDAQLWATAKLNQISAIYSEDFNVEATIEGIKFINPLVTVM